MTDGAELDDRALVERVACGDSASFAELYDRHAGIVLGLLTRMLGRDGTAEEVLQETFLQAWEQASRYDEARATPRGWLLVIARSRALDRIRSRTSRQQRDRRATDEDLLLSGSVGAEGPARLEEEERSLRIRAALDELPSEQRRAIELAFFDGLTHNEVATALGAPLGTVKSRILLGMRKLRTVLTPYRS